MTSSLKTIAAKISRCSQCPLSASAGRAVPGHGLATAEIVFIGEAPGFYEDQQGLPFVGVAGKLLDRLLAQISLDRQDVWIGNIIKHRPPNNRDPLPAEIAACRPFLTAQLKIINPLLIISLGRFAMNYFLPAQKISRIHGHPWFVFLSGQKKVLLPLYHPAAALRDRQVMLDLEKDFCKIPLLLKRLRSATA